MKKSKTRQIKITKLDRNSALKAPNRDGNDEKSMGEWKNVNWRKLERRVFKLQKRIYQASSRGDVKTLRRLQKTLMRSWSAKMLAVRRVSQDNQGKKTAGVDGVKSLTPKQRLTLVTQLKLSSKSKPTRRVWIPKPGKQEKRPLGIPTLHERAKQALIKLALEPEWEARFEPNSYGFRPGRSCQDAIVAIHTAIKQKDKYVLDADISKCFDKINHSALLRKLNTFPTFRRQIKAWLKAGIMDGERLFPTDVGTPQGGVLSPLLANIALHGMEERVKQFAATLDIQNNRGFQVSKKDKISALNFIRYADDFVVLHPDINVVQRCQQIIAEWLKGMGLELSASKTQITHTFKSYETKKPGFDFLGFHIRQYPVGKYHTGKKPNGKPLGFKTLIKPSSQKLKEHTQAIGNIIKSHKSLAQVVLINRLNPVIRGWAKYYSSQVSKDIYSLADKHTYQQLRAWAQRRHPNKGKNWVVNRYWLINKGEGWVFGFQKEGKTTKLLKHSETPIVRHTKVKGNRTPYDGDLVYWCTRMGQHPQADKVTATLLKRQKGKCTHCGLFFRDEDVMEVDHVIPKSKGGKSKYDNLQLLHRHCHDQKTVMDNFPPVYFR